MELPVLNCDGCGGCCCRGVVMPPFVPWEGDEEWVRFEAEHPELHAELAAEYARLLRDDDRTDDGPCFWLSDDGRCMHYAERPEICRIYEVGSDSCLEARRAFHPDSTRS